MLEAHLCVRCDPREKRRFLDVCKLQGIDASDALRQFIREYADGRLKYTTTMEKTDVIGK